jgi:hypothetical protein
VLDRTGPKRRGPKCEELEKKEQAALTELEELQKAVKADADPQAAVFGLPSAQLRVAQAGAMVILCLCSGLFISFGAGLIWR